MKTLLEIYDPTTSDKGTNHSYIEHIYEDLFSKYRNSADAVLEIGTYEGGSLYMWKEYFTKAKIYGIESFKRVDIIDERDISGTEVLDGLISCIPNGLEFKVFDLRHLKNRWDDLVLVIKK